MIEKEIFGGLVRLHVLYHASHERIFGLGIIEELAEHGYKLSPGTLYPILHGMERNGYLASAIALVGKRNRRVYAITPKGRAALKVAKARVWELFREFFEEELAFGAPGAGHPRSSKAGVPNEVKAKRGRRPAGRTP